MGSLCDLIVGGCTPFTTVWAVRRRNGTWYPVLVSQTIKGPTLQNLLLENPDATCFPQLDYKQYCQAVIMALLTNPEDGKSDNYIVTEHAGKYKVYSVDNDHSFVPPRVRRWFSMAPLVKCILFCFDEMMKPVHTEVRLQISKVFPPINMHDITNAIIGKRGVVRSVYQQLPRNLAKVAV